MLSVQCAQVSFKWRKRCNEILQHKPLTTDERLKVIYNSTLYRDLRCWYHQVLSGQRQLPKVTANEPFDCMQLSSMCSSHFERLWDRVTRVWLRGSLLWLNNIPAHGNMLTNILDFSSFPGSHRSRVCDPGTCCYYCSSPLTRAKLGKHWAWFWSAVNTSEPADRWGPPGAIWL